MEKLLHSIEDTQQRLGLGRSSVYELMGSGKLASVKIGRRRMIPAHALEEFVATLEVVPTTSRPE